MSKTIVIYYKEKYKLLEVTDDFYKSHNVTIRIPKLDKNNDFGAIELKRSGRTYGGFSVFE